MACELEGRIIPMHKGRHERTWPGKDLDSETVSGTEIGKLLLQSFLKQGILCVQGGHVSIYGWEPDQIPSSVPVVLKQGMYQPSPGSFKKKSTHPGAPNQTY